MEKISCDGCGRKIPDTEESCPHCGQMIQKNGQQTDNSGGAWEKWKNFIAVCAAAVIILGVIVGFSFHSYNVSGGEQSSGIYVDDNGNNVFVSDGGKDVWVSEIPHAVPYNSKKFTLSDVECYENRTSDYSYNLFVVVTFDIGELSDDEGHWLGTEDLDVDVYVTNEKNELDFDPLSFLGQVRWTDEKTIQVVKMSSALDKNRYSFAGSEIVVSVRAAQEETYKSSGGYDIHKEEGITYQTMIGSSLPDAEKIPEPLYDNVVKWLQRESDFWGTLNSK